MGFDVNLAAINHPEVASDIDRLASRLFLTDYCKALSCALICNCDFHKIEINKPESKERLVIEYSIRLDKKQDKYSR